jgi:hypothetical protein
LQAKPFYRYLKFMRWLANAPHQAIRKTAPLDNSRVPVPFRRSVCITSAPSALVPRGPQMLDNPIEAIGANTNYSIQPKFALILVARLAARKRTSLL